MGTHSGRWGWLTAVVLLLLLGTAVRFYCLECQSFWNDEGNSARLSERSVQLILEGTASDVHPPLYYLLLHGWRELVGETEFGLRSLSAFLGLLTVGTTIALGKHWFNRPVALMAGLLVAVSPPLIYYSQEARMYSLLGWLSLLGLWWVGQFFIRFHPLPEPVEGKLSASTSSASVIVGGIILTAVAGLYTHYSYPATLVALNLIVALWLGWRIWHKQAISRPLAQWVGAMGVTFLLYLPWLPIFMRGTGGRPPAKIPLLDFLQSAAHWLVVGATGEPDERAVGIVLLFFVAALLPLFVLRQPLTKREDDPSWALWLALFVPFGAMAAVGATDESYHKFMTGLVPLVWLLTAVGVVKLWRTAPAYDRWVVPRDLSHMVYTAVYLLTLFTLSYLAPPLWFSLQNLYHNPDYAKADYRGMAAQIKAESHPEAGIILNAPNQWEVFTYYYNEEETPIYPLAQNRLDEATVATELSQIAAQHSRLYALFWGEAERDPERLVERWLDAHAFKAVDEWRGDVRFVVYAVPPATATEPEVEVNLPVGEAITLHGYALNDAADFRPGDILQLTLFWQTSQPLEARYKVFVHLLDYTGVLVAQRDSEPVGNLKPTNTWAVGELVVDNHGVLLPATLPAGDYAVQIGLYEVVDDNTAVRLPITTPEGNTVDSWRLSTITVTSRDDLQITNDE